MGIFLIGIIFAIICVVWIILSNTVYKNKLVEYPNVIAIISGILAVVILITAGTLTIIFQSNKEIEYHNAMYEKSVLEYRQEADSDGDNDLLYSEIVEFNNNLRSTKYFANNFWTNCFNNDMIATIDYIELQAPVIDRHPEFAVNDN